MSFKNEITNEQVSLFVKLFGHFSHGGSLIYNTQDLKDTHYGFKRCTSSMLWIHSRIKFPFFSVFKVRELISMTDDTVQTSNNFNEDIELSFLKFTLFFLFTATARKIFFRDSDIMTAVIIYFCRFVKRLCEFCIIN